MFGKKKFDRRLAPSDPQGKGRLLNNKPSLGAIYNRVQSRKGVWSMCTIASDQYGANQAYYDREAIVLDLSDFGARIRFRSRTTLPNRVYIRSPRLGLTQEAHVIWQNDFDAGLQFLSADTI